mgnify:CR=1 FL=1
MPDAFSKLPLRDVIAPGEPLWWPPAPGWWLLFFVSLIIAGLLIRRLRKRYARGYAPVRKAALRELGELQAQSELEDSLFAEQVSALLKRAAIVRYGERQPAGLSGEAWLSFLDQTAPQSEFTRLGEEGLLDAQYRATRTVDRNALINAARRWIRAQ